MKVEVGDYVRCNKTKEEDLGDLWVKKMLKMLDGKYRKVLIKFPSFLDKKIQLEIDGISGGSWSYCYQDLDVISEEEYMRIMTEEEEKIELFGKQSLLPTPQKWGEKHQLYTATEANGDIFAYIEQPKIDKNDNGWIVDNWAINITKLVQPQTGENWKNSLYIPTSLRPNYMPYTEFDTNWIGEKVKFKEAEYYVVGAFNNKIVLYYNNNFSKISYECLLEWYRWAKDNTRCGKKTKIKENKDEK